jgi:hypothetical protein
VVLPVLHFSTWARRRKHRFRHAPQIQHNNRHSARNAGPTYKTSALCPLRVGLVCIYVVRFRHL